MTSIREHKVLVSHVELFVLPLLTTYLPKHFTYHNIQHTKDVVKNCGFIAKKMNIPEREVVWLLIAAWFHDVGYLVDRHRHEDESGNIARLFLLQEQVESENIAKVMCYIDATKIPHNPQNELAAILSDADTFHFGLPQFMPMSIKLKRENAALSNVELELVEFIGASITFLEMHEFKTDYCKTHLEEGKMKNISRLVKLEHDLINFKIK